MGAIKNKFQQADTNAFIWCQKRFDRQVYYPFIRVVSASGDGWLYGLIIISAFIYNSSENLNFLLSAALSFTLEVPLYLLLKNKFKRNRPEDYLAHFKAQIRPSDRFSFPSGHTAAAFVFVVQLLMFFPAYFVPGLIWAFSVGISRVALGVHFPGDILAGATLGTLCGLLASNLII